MFIEIQKTKEELAKESVIAFSKESQSVLDNYKYNYQRLFNMIWNTKVHPQDFFDCMGTNAVKVFQAAQETVTYIKKFDPAYTPEAALYEYVINQNGTVTVGDKLEEEVVV